MTRTVRLIVNTNTSYGRGTLQGIARYSRENGPWSLILDPIGFGMPQYDLASVRPDGVIARVVDQAGYDAVRRIRGVPVVNLSSSFSRLPYPVVTGDVHSLVQSAADHLQACGFRRAAYCGVADQQYSKSRGEAFAAAAQTLGMSCEIYPVGSGKEQVSLRRELGNLKRWLTRFTQPVGILACNDHRAQHVMLAALMGQIPVPDRLGVICVGNDEVICQTCHVPLTSVDVPTENIGYHAAAVLDHLMQGQPAPSLTDFPRRSVVVPRASTDVLILSDPIIRHAVMRMRSPDNPPRSIDELLDEVPLSRRPFEKRFRQALGRSPYTELQACRIRLAKTLLRTTELPIAQIAEQCGYRYPHHLSAAFRKATQTTPAAYRKA